MLELEEDCTNFMADCSCYFPPFCCVNAMKSTKTKDVGCVLEDLPLLIPSDISYADFFSKYLIQNKPCVFTEDITADWAARKDWVQTENSKVPTINFENLRKVYGMESVKVTDCSDDSAMRYGGGQIKDMSLNDFIDYWERFINKDYPASMPCYYLKDWHIMKSSTNYIPYVTPKYFTSDWLNEAWDDNVDTDDDFRFAYMGPKGSWTAFHSDVYGSFSWSANIVGTKKWLIYPPGKESQFSVGGGRFEFDYFNPGIKNVDYYEVIQEAGQIIFVPSGWHHIVWNMTDVISINHNWMNGANIGYIWSTLQRALGDVKEEIKDLMNIAEFKEQCQLILKANHGIDYEMFFDVVSLILSKRKQSEPTTTMCSLGLFHTRFDMNSINHVIKSHILQDTDALSCIENRGKWDFFLQNP